MEKAKKGQRYPNSKPLYDDNQAKAVSDAGGILFRVNLDRPPDGLNGGCGTPTHVEGTNGGKMPCGSYLTMFGVREPYYCGSCSSNPIIRGN